MSEAKEKKKKGINPLVIIIVLLVLVIVGLAAYFLFLKKTPVSNVPKPIIQASWSTDEFLVNLADKDTERYLKTNITLTYDSADSELPKKLDDQKYAVRDAIISVIRTKTMADLQTPDGMDILKTQIIKRVNAVLGGDKIINAYYYDVLIQ